MVIPRNQRQLLQQFIAEDLLEDEAEIGLDDNLLADDLIDSLGIVRLVAYIEDEFGYTVPHEDITIDHFCTINKLADYLASQPLEETG